MSSSPLVSHVAAFSRATLLTVALALPPLAVVVVPLPALAQPAGVDEEKGRDFATEAMGHYNEGSFEDALQAFDQAKEVYPAAQVLRMRGYTLMAMERWIEAAEAIDEALKSDFKPLVPADAEHAEDQLKKVLTHIAEVRVESAIDGAVVMVDGGDGQPLPAIVRLKPGAHGFVVQAEGYEPTEERHELKPGKTTLTIDPREEGEEAPPPPPPPEPEPDEPDEPTDVFGWFPGQGPVGLTTAAVGIVTGGLGLASGLYGMSLRSAVRDNVATHNASFGQGCARSQDLCRANAQLINRDGARAADFENAGLIMGITGGSLFLVGTTLWLLSDDSPLAPDEPSEPADAWLQDVSCGGAVTGELAAFGCRGSF